MISLIRALSSNAKEAKFIRDELTVYCHAAREHRRLRRDADRRAVALQRGPERLPGPAPVPSLLLAQPGYDINRYHPYLTDYPLDNPNTPASDAANPVPESLNVRALYDMAGGADAVEVVIDLHGQATPLDANRDMVFSSTLWPTATPTADAIGVRPQFDAAAELSKRVISVALMARDKIAHANTEQVCRRAGARDLAECLRPPRLGLGPL